MQHVLIDNLVDRYPDLIACKEALEVALDMLLECYRTGGKVMTCGNGGSAADSEHIVGELMKSFNRKRPLDSGFVNAYQDTLGCTPPSYLEGALPAISLVSQSALMTAFANDETAEGVFAQQVYGYGKPGDVLIAISTSGNSVNVVEAAKVAKALGVKVVALTGQAASALSALADVAIRVPCNKVYQIQELHLPVYHALCATLEEELF